MLLHYIFIFSDGFDDGRVRCQPEKAKSSFNKLSSFSRDVERIEDVRKLPVMELIGPEAIADDEGGGVVAAVEGDFRDEFFDRGMSFGAQAIPGGIVCLLPSGTKLPDTVTGLRGIAAPR
ncbi:hypothetical protein [Shinella sumterensis]|uniref:Uncharacterized protein n=1 Tax=Shinella sumterensis TaxID=1967501 RepID=A0AA50H6S3_9HYPH|nr:hypothetical protein [Shinella sumterensis]WLR96019.1 hypothetical protein Q9313_09695 [Shinella sumterensis]